MPEGEDLDPVLLGLAGYELWIGHSLRARRGPDGLLTLRQEVGPTRRYVANRFSPRVGRSDLVSLSLYSLLASNRSGVFVVYFPLFLSSPSEGASIPVALAFLSAAYVA